MEHARIARVQELAVTTPSSARPTMGRWRRTPNTWGRACVLPRSHGVAGSLETGAALPARVLAAFEPSESCLCNKQGCFYAAPQDFDAFRVAEGISTGRWPRAGPRNEDHQLSSGLNRTEVMKAGMAVTREAITASSGACPAYRTPFCDAGVGGRRPALEATPRGSPVCRGSLAGLERQSWRTFALSLFRRELARSDEVRPALPSQRLGRGRTGRDGCQQEKRRHKTNRQGYR